jgi:hypothetical protein
MPTTATLIPLQQFYLMAIASILDEMHALDCILEDKANGAGRLWLLRQKSKTTAPHGWIAFSFEDECVRFAVGTRRDNATWNHVSPYAEGIDGFLERLTKHLSEGLLAKPKMTRSAA